ncbi:hypothetical protein D9V37_06295 [Nocardioides mangrovicus]|uniref:Uncharacterized protein n=1 Tax=Nocardioides mangrovicus TaxID=2478913 RepID=A0A3L8P2L6_9ACTN|nr:HGxxPAAW family protein [Nocardioides mangrovicus]RLV49535.1 hypothetical protein D9V37_06295 [Nocardioides mangrovicus]
MSSNHGNTPAAWTGVTIMTLAFVVAGIGAVAYSWVVFWIGVALLPIGLVVGKAMSLAGYGSQGPEQH